MSYPRPMLTFSASWLIVLASVVASAPAHSESATPEETGLKIARESSAREEGFGNFTAQQAMVLRNKAPTSRKSPGGYRSRRQKPVRIR